MEERNAFGRVMKALRKAEGLSVADAARRLGVSRASVYEWESGTNGPPLMQLLPTIHRAYGRRVTLTNFLELAVIEKAPKEIRSKLRAKCRNPLYAITLTAPRLRIQKRA